MGSVTGGPYRNAFWPVGLAPEKPFTTSRRVYRVLSLDDHAWVYRGLDGFYPLSVAQGSYYPIRSCRPCPQEYHRRRFDDYWYRGLGIVGVLSRLWEYGRMHEPVEMTRGWDDVLQRVFPGPKRQAEINSVRQLLRILFTRVLSKFCQCITFSI